MKLSSAVAIVVFFSIGGAAVGWAEASGLMAFIEPDRAATRSRRWKPITNEEYRRKERSYPLYGAAIGCVVGLIFVLRGPSDPDEKFRYPGDR